MQIQSEKYQYSYKLSLAILFLIYIIIFASMIPLYLWTLKFESHTLIRVLILQIIHTVVLFVFSFIFSNSSIYDLYWFTTPVGYILLMNYDTPYKSTAKNVLNMLPLLSYCLKQTIYFLRFYPGLSFEDFRHKKCKQNFTSKAKYWIFSFFVTHMFKTIMTFFRMAPIYYTLNQDPSNQQMAQQIMTYVGAFLTLSGVGFEAVADEQLLPKRQSQTKDCIQHGLWRYSRHPNYLGQIGIWWGIFITIFSVVNPPYWTVTGALMITALFNFHSIPTMENYLLEKRDKYEEYQQQVSRLIPWFRFTKNIDK